jgi:hypothetical protein
MNFRYQDLSEKKTTMNDVNFIKASLTLHNAVPVRENRFYNRNLLKHGYIAPDNISETVERVLIDEAIKLNSTFYTCWKDVTNKTREELAVDQVCHYISVAISDVLQCPDVVYIPNLKTNEERSVPLRFIKGLAIPEIKDLTRSLLYKKVALKEDTIKAAFDILQTHEVDIAKVQNRDSKTYILVRHGITPRDPLDILRCAVYDVTGELTLIKNKTMYDKIEEGHGDRVVRWLQGNEERLATIFNRYKPIFMSMKTHAAVKPHVNKISKLSKKHHTPMKAATHEPTTGYEIVRHVKYLIENKKPKVYQVRNGKMWCTRDRKNEIDKYVSKLKAILPDTFIQSDKTRLALPTSEKNFCGAFPIGTRFGMNTSCSTDAALIVGIHWRNQNGERVDLDLSAVDMEGKVGWNADYYTSDRDIIFSGDITDACDGANEYLYFKNVTRPKVVLVNRYTRHENDVAMDIILASSNKAPSRNEILDDKEIIATASTVCSEKQKTLGIVYPTDDGPRFVLIDKCIGKKMTVGAVNEDDSEIMIDSFMNGYIYMDEYATATTNNRAPTGTVDLSNKVVSKSTMLGIFEKR